MLPSLFLLALLGALAASGGSLEILTPKGELWLQPGESVEVAVRSTTAPVEVVLGDGRRLVMQKSDGIYRALVPGHPSMQVVAGGQRQALGPVRLLSGPLPAARVVKENAVFRSGPDESYDRYEPLPAGLQALVSGRQGSWLRLEPAGGWVEDKDIQLLPPGTPPSHPVLRGVRIQESPGAPACLRLRLDQPAAWQVFEEPGRLLVRLPGARQAMGEVVYPPQSRRVRELRLRPDASGVSVEVDLGPEGLWGYTLTWQEPDLVLELAPPPRLGWRNPPVFPYLSPDSSAGPSPLAGLCVVLDPGHGGDDSGAVGVAGTAEKDLNLQVALALEQELRQAGASVVLTRRTDRALTPPEAPPDQELAARVEAARRAGGQLFLSIHHNAMADVEAARRAHGTHIYYYRAQSHALAACLAPALAAAYGEPDYAALWRSFHVIRQSAMPAVLVEVNFLSNPAEEEKMRQPDYPARMAAGLRRGLEEFLRAASRGNP